MDNLNLKPLEFVNFKRENKRTYTLQFKRPTDFYWEAGSQIGLSFGDERDIHRRCSLIISNGPHEEYIEITTYIDCKCVFNQELTTLSQGDLMYISSIDNIVPLRREDRQIVALTNDIGIAAIKPMVQDFITCSTFIPSFVSINSSNSQQLFKDYFSKYENELLETHHVSSKEKMVDFISGFSFMDNPIYYIVGETDFNKFIGNALLEKGIESSSIVMKQIRC